MKPAKNEADQFSRIAAEVRSDMKREGVAPDNVWTAKEALAGFLEVLRRMEDYADE